MEEWVGNYEGYNGIVKREWKLIQSHAKQLIQTRKFWYTVVPLVFIIVYALWPTEKVQRDNYGVRVDNFITLNEKLMVHHNSDHDVFMRNSSITVHELEQGVVPVNYSSDNGSPVLQKNVTMSELKNTCQRYYQENPDDYCVCLRNFGLLMRGACVNISNTIEVALNIRLDRDHWSNNDKEYKVNGRRMELPDKTLITFFSPDKKKHTSTAQYRNICLILCHDGHCSH